MNYIKTLEELKFKIVENFKNNTLFSIRFLIESYNGDDWKKYVRFTNDTYHKELVAAERSFDIYIISWKKNQQTKIHDHPNRGCLMKVLDGKIREDVYNNSNPPVLQRTNFLNIDDTGYREGDLFLHKITPIFDSVSLHVYSPPGYKPKYYEIKN